jgi:hypothetical protein
MLLYSTNYRMVRNCYQPINVPTAWALLMEDTRKRPSVNLSAVYANADPGTNGLTCVPKHGGASDNQYLVTHLMINLCKIA